MNETQSKAVLDLLVEEGKVKEKDLFDALERCPTEEMKRCTDVIHNLMCKKDHGSEDVEPECEYWSEDQLDACWNRDEHLTWLKKTREVMTELGFDNESELKNAVAAVHASIGKAEKIKGAVDLLSFVLSHIT